MNWFDIPRDPPLKVLRQFAGAWVLFVGGAGVRLWLSHRHDHLGQVMVVAGLVVGLLGLSKPAAVRWLYVGAMLLASPLGWVVSQLMLAILFYLILMPVALWFRLRGRDLLARKPAPERTSYWSEKTIPQDVRSYFRQY